MQKITPFLWFDDQAEEAARLYISLFKNSRIVSMSRFGEAGTNVAARLEGSVMTVVFELEGQRFIALNGGPVFKFTEALSFIVECGTQKDMDELWEKLSAGGEKGRCGWLKDAYGVSWQIVPTVLGKLLQDDDLDRANRVMQAMLQMTKIDIKGLQRAYHRK
ncbi:MAG: VOC family protein [Minisyncoccota bacterium]